MRDTELQARVGRLRQIIADAIPIPAPVQRSAEEEDAWRRYSSFAANDPLPASDDSTRAKSARKINRIAMRYNLTSEIQRYLDERGAVGISSLDDDCVQSLLEHMTKLEDCIQQGCDPPDMPAAR